jgi:hypothetical protein
VIVALKEPRRSCEERVVHCPFYGFTWPEASRQLRQVPGNQCALALDRAEPCAMEVAGESIEIDRCPVAIRSAHLIRWAAPVIVFITPQHPEGLPYSEWKRAVIAQQA